MYPRNPCGDKEDRRDKEGGRANRRGIGEERWEGIRESFPATRERRFWFFKIDRVTTILRNDREELVKQRFHAAAAPSGLSSTPDSARHWSPDEQNRRMRRRKYVRGDSRIHVRIGDLRAELHDTWASTGSSRVARLARGLESRPTLISLGAQSAAQTKPSVVALSDPSFWKAGRKVRNPSALSRRGTTTKAPGEIYYVITARVRVM